MLKSLCRRHRRAAAAATPAFAQSTDAALPDPNDQSDTFTHRRRRRLSSPIMKARTIIGSSPPRRSAAGRAASTSSPARTYLYVDFIPRGDGALEFDLGPDRRRPAQPHRQDQGRFRRRCCPSATRRSRSAAFAGVTYHGLTNPYDALSFRLDVVKDVGGAHESTLITPTIDFGTPLSRTHLCRRFAERRVGRRRLCRLLLFDPPPMRWPAACRPLTPTAGSRVGGSACSVNQSITGDLTHGLSIFGTGSYTHLSGDFKDSPIVDDRGSASQWFGALGVAYTF